VTLARTLLQLSSVVFAGVGIGYLGAPGAMLSIVGIPSNATSDFLLRTEGVAMLAAAGIIWASTQLRAGPNRLVLVSVAGYYLLGSVVDLAAFWQGIVGAASVPSAGARLVLAALCVGAAVKLPREATDGS
jgi:hypothetical protein